MDARVAIEPSTGATAGADAAAADRRRAEIAHAVRESGAQLVPVDDANALVWLAMGDPSTLVALLKTHPNIVWVQLPWAGVENFASGGAFRPSITFTCAKGAYAEQVGEHALTLALTCLRRLVQRARVRQWLQLDPESLFRKRVTILGGGGIATTLIGLLQPFDCTIRVLRRRPGPVEGAHETRAITDLHSLLPETDVLVLALALTPETTRIIGPPELALLPPHSVLVNVARGRHVDTPALVDALRRGALAAAGLDVTDPEPLPPDHPLWSFDNVLITSHSGDSVSFVTEKLVERVRDNVLRFRRGDPLLGVVDVAAGY